MRDPPVVPSSRRPARRAAIIVLDGLGIGTTWDQDRYGDSGSDTLGNVLRVARDLPLPNLRRLGLGNCRPLQGLAPSDAPQAASDISHAFVAAAVIASVASLVALVVLPRARHFVPRLRLSPSAMPTH